MNETKTTTQLPSFGISNDEIIKLLNYPNLDKLFDEANPNALGEIRVKFEKTMQDLERVIRQGAKEDAEKAEKVLRAIKVTLEVLADIENLKTESD
jgi:hypothetical protein